MDNFANQLNNIQKEILSEGLDGWLLYDFRGSNELARQMLEIPETALLTRRYAYWIPKTGQPIKLVQAIESGVLDHLPGGKKSYSTWQEWEGALKQILSGSKKVAMEYSPRGALPYISKVDAGTIDLVRSYGVEVATSANLLQKFTSAWNDAKLKSHLEAAALLSSIADQVWEHISKCLKQGQPLTEWDVQQFMLAQFEENQCVTDDPPICALNAHSADPHYMPSASCSPAIKAGDFILIDLWCKKNAPNATYGDITRVAVASQKPTAKQNEIFQIVRAAQKAAVKFIQERFQRKEPVRGWEVDQVCRDLITQAGYGKYFIHRTGHNIDVKDHGNGTHIDNYETHDERLLIPRTCFSIEPGIYLPGEFGVRLEFDVYIHEDGRLQITGGEQNELTCLL